MLKTRLDWWLEFNSILPANLFDFRKGLGKMKCLSTFIGNIYHSFNNKEFLVTTFVDICSAFDSVNIPTLITYLLLLNVPSKFCNVLSALFNFRKLVFLLPSDRQILDPLLLAFLRVAALAQFYSIYI
jgi:hypothetical protein